MFKNIDKKLACNNAIHRNTRLFVICKQDILFYYDKCPCFIFCKFKACPHKLIDCLVAEPLAFILFLGKRKNTFEVFFLSQLFQCFSEFRLEYNHNCYNCYINYLACYPEYGREIKNIGNNQKYKNYNNAF